MREGTGIGMLNEKILFKKNKIKKFEKKKKENIRMNNLNLRFKNIKLFQWQYKHSSVSNRSKDLFLWPSIDDSMYLYLCYYGTLILFQ